jgi:predicted transcriptional regulator of viral defense system
MKYEKDFIEYFSKLTLFSSDDADRFLSHYGSDYSYSRVFLHNLVVNGKLYRITKGIYTFSRNEAVYGFAFRPFYYGMEFALSVRKLWTQQANPVIITLTKSNAGIRKILGTNITIRRISQNAFFGFEYLNYMDLFIPVSRPEKIFLDFIYYGIDLDGETLINLMSTINPEILKEYAQRLGKRYLSSALRIFSKFSQTIA